MQGLGSARFGCRRIGHFQPAQLGPDHFLLFRRRPSPLLPGGYAGRSAVVEASAAARPATRATVGALTAEASGWIAAAGRTLPSIPTSIEDPPRAASAPSPAPPTTATGTTARVESGGRVRLQQQRSGSPCREGYSWGSDGKLIWVDHGCRADFAVEGGRARAENRIGAPDGAAALAREATAADYLGGQNLVISCSSDDMHRHYCPADTRGGVQLLKQRSDSSCRQGRSWGYDRSGIWVDHGCRADFPDSCGKPPSCR